MAEPVTAATLLVTYRTNVVGLPGKGSATSVRERVQVIASDTFTAVNDVGYGLRIALARPSELKTGRLLAVAFDACERDAPPSLEDFRCIVEGCGGPGGIVDGCACSLSVAGNAFGGAP